MTADAKMDGRIDWGRTLALLESTYPNPNFPIGTDAYTSDFGLVIWNGSYWENQTAGTFAANATGTQASGTLLSSELCNITAAGGNYSVTLPVSVPGNIIMVHNISTQTLKVFPSAGGTTTEAINALGANNSLSMLTNTSTAFTCVVAGQWYTVPRVPS